MDQHRLEAIESRLTTTLMGWGIASTAVGSALWVAGARSGRQELLRFGRQTALWGATDVAIALAGAWGRRRRGDLDHAEVETTSRTLLITLVANAAADVVYVAGGARVWSRTGAQQATSSQEPVSSSPPGTYLGMGRGDGAAIMIQGAFLLGLDAVFALRLRRATTSAARVERAGI